MPKRMLQGAVVSNTQAKTVVVRVERRFTHPVLKKTVRNTKKYYAHDENNEYGVGDVVWIEEHRPISKLKRWIVVRGVNLVKRHQKQSQTQEGGIVSKEGPIHLSNIAFADPNDGKATRIGFKIQKDGTRVRVAKRSGAEIDG